MKPCLIHGNLNISLAKEAGIRVNREVIVDQFIRTHSSDISQSIRLVKANACFEYRGDTAVSAVGKDAYYEGVANVVILGIAAVSGFSVASSRTY